MTRVKRLLCLRAHSMSAHCDDIEIGADGTIIQAFTGSAPPNWSERRFFERLTAHEKRAMFDWEGDQATVKSWVRKGIAWRLADAADPDLSRALGMQDIVVANNFLCHWLQPMPKNVCEILRSSWPRRIPVCFRSGSGRSNKGRS